MGLRCALSSVGRFPRSHAARSAALHEFTPVVAALGMSTRGEDVLWVDYEAAVSLHRVVTNKPKDRRLERLATPTPLDNRISYGCINVPKRFYEKVVSPAFKGTDGIVYVLPETRPARVVFGSYDIEERVRHLYADQAPQNTTIAGQ